MSSCGHYTTDPSGVCNVCWFARHAANVGNRTAVQVVCHRCEGAGFTSYHCASDRRCELCDGVGHLHAELWTPERSERRLEWIRQHAPHLLEDGGAQ